MACITGRKCTRTIFCCVIVGYIADGTRCCRSTSTTDCGAFTHSAEHESSGALHTRLPFLLHQHQNATRHRVLTPEAGSCTAAMFYAVTGSKQSGPPIAIPDGSQRPVRITCATGNKYTTLHGVFSSRKTSVVRSCRETQDGLPLA